MSIYPVRLNEWFPKGDEYYAKHIVKCMKCLFCGKEGKKINYKYAMGHHSLPWGYGDIWCSSRCLNKWRKQPYDQRNAR